MNLEVNIGGIQMDYPVVPASGTFGIEYLRLTESDGTPTINPKKLGAIVLKSVTLEPRQGNPQPRLCEVKVGSLTGLINCIGLQNDGVDAFIRNTLPLYLLFGCPIIASIAGFSIYEFGELAQRFNATEVNGLEVNVSCPNVEGGRVPFGREPEMVKRVTEAVRQATRLPIIVKLTPNLKRPEDIVLVAQAAVEAGANAVSLINTVKIRRKIKKGPHAGQWIKGGLSGPPIRDRSLALVKLVAQAGLGVPVIGGGGICDFGDALRLFKAGAAAVFVGTATFINPQTMKEVVDGLKKYMRENGISSFQELIRKLRQEGA